MQNIKFYLPGQAFRADNAGFFSSPSKHGLTSYVNKSLYLLVAVISLVLFFFNTTDRGCIAQAAEQSEASTILHKRYDLAKFYYHNLLSRPDLATSRHNWDAAIRAFRHVYLAQPKHELAPSTLFMMGRMCLAMYDQFHNPLDLGEAVAYFEDVAKLFPKHYLADDALYILGNTYIDDKNDRELAAKTFSRILASYSEGDMAQAAADQLENLQDVVDNVGQTIALEARQIDEIAEVQSIKYWSNNDYTRVVIMASAPVSFKDHLLEKIGNQPRRLYIDFSNSRIAPEDRTPIPIQDGLLKRVRAGQFSDDTVRVVLDIESISKFKLFNLQDPFRVVVDVMGRKPENSAGASASTAGGAVVRQVKTAAAAGPLPRRPQTHAAAHPSPLSLAQQLGLGVKRIVIDPGHGGKDPGCIARNGLKEKDVVLRVARKLAKKLREEYSYDVILTRDRDIFIPLEERTAIANTSKADLFISIHANAAPSPKVRGVETYFLNLTTNADAMRVAARENATTANNMSDLQDILSDLLNNAKLNESAKLAKQVQANMANGLNLKSLGVKQAPFYVLIGAQMPAILTEISFLSNPQEAEKLKNDSFLSAVADQIVTGVSYYVSDSSLASLTN